MPVRYVIGAGLVLAALVLLLATAGAMAGSPGQARGQGGCAPRSELVDHLARKFGEVRVASGVTHAGGLIETFAAASGTWTILVTSPGGRSCLVATGDGWRAETGPPLLSPRITPGAERGT